VATYLQLIVGLGKRIAKLFARANFRITRVLFWSFFLVAFLVCFSGLLFAVAPAIAFHFFKQTVPLPISQHRAS
jgi:hypothetical protein